jgi:hypothetical protein
VTTGPNIDIVHEQGDVVQAGAVGIEQASAAVHWFVHRQQQVAVGVDHQLAGVPGLGWARNDLAGRLETEDPLVPLDAGGHIAHHDGKVHDPGERGHV